MAFSSDAFWDPLAAWQSKLQCWHEEGPGRSSKHVGSKWLLRESRHHVGWLPCWKHSLARLGPRFLLSSPWEQGDLGLWSSGDRGFQLDGCSALRWQCENIPTWPDSFLKSVALYHNEPGSKPTQNQEYNFPFLSQEPWQSSSSTPLFKPHTAIISQKSMISKRYFCRPGNMEQEFPQRNPSEKITHYYFVHLRYLASPDCYGFEFFILYIIYPLKFFVRYVADKT